jgi:type VII secretion-associated serine protease mycosin
MFSRMALLCALLLAGVAGGLLLSHPGSLNARPISLGVAHARPKTAPPVQRTPNDPYLREQWALENIQAYQAWDITTGDDITIAVIDTGIWSGHPDLQGKVLDGYNVIEENNQTDDMNGHGTAVAGLIAARTDNDKGIAGMCWDCSLLPVRALDEQGRGNTYAVAHGIRWATDAGARIINLSLGGTADTRVLRDAVAYAYNNNVLLVAASGNAQQDGNPESYPAAYPQVLAVSSTGNTSQITGFANTGPYIDLAAPGVGLWTTIPGERQYGPPNGTSFSSSYVAGTAALIWSLRPELSNRDVQCILEASADDLGPQGKDPQYGWGRLNAFQALQLTQDYSTCPLETAGPQPEAAPVAFAPVPQPETSGSVAYFPETQHTLRGIFKDYWESHGGLPIFGYPISEEFIERGSDGRSYTVQYFQRHRFELHPESQPPYHVQLSRLGAVLLEQQGRAWQSFAQGTPTPNCRYFEATGHTLCEPFLSYWQSHGLEFDGQAGKSFAESLALFGQPLSEPQTEEIAPGVSVTVQWFERARFELHQEGVLLGLLSSELVQKRGWR